jgi:HK97 family phage major capsid protein
MTILQQIGRAQNEIETRAGSRDFVQLARCLMLSKGVLQQARQIAEQRGTSDRVEEILRKANPGTLTDPTWAGNLSPYASVAAGFVDGLRHIGAFDAMLTSMVRVPLRARIVMITTGATGNTVAEAAAKPQSELDLDELFLEPTKAVCDVVVSNEVLKSDSPDSFAFLQRALQDSVAAQTDSAFVSAISSGITPTTSSGDPREDIGILFDNVATGSRSKLFLLVGSTIAKAWALAAAGGAATFPNATAMGGIVCGTPVLVTDAVAGGSIVAADASGIAAASDTVTLDSSQHANLDMAGGSSPTFSLWQKNCTSLRAERFFGVKRLRDTAVAVVNNVSYTATA